MRGVTISSMAPSENTDSKTVAVIQARMNSTRVPGKVMLPLAGIPVLDHIVERARNIRGVDGVCISIPDGGGQDAISAFAAEKPGVILSRGPQDDIVGRLANAAKQTGATELVRIWADCPAFDPVVVSSLLAAYRASAYDWASIEDNSGFPLGYGVQILSAPLIAVLNRDVRDATDRELLGPYLESVPSRYPALRLCRSPSLENVNLMLDTEADLRRLRLVFDRLFPESPLFGERDIEALVRDGYDFEPERISAP